MRPEQTQRRRQCRSVERARSGLRLAGIVRSRRFLIAVLALLVTIPVLIGARKLALAAGRA